MPSSTVLIEGYKIDEILAFPRDVLDAFVFRDEAVVFQAGSAQVLGKFVIYADTLILELAQIDGGGEGVLPTIAKIAKQLAEQEKLAFVEWRVHAVSCAHPNLKLRRLMQRRGFVVRTIDGVGECYWLRSPMA